MKKIILSTFLLFLGLNVKAEESNLADLDYKTQVAFLESGIFLDQCNIIKNKMGLDEKSCDLLDSQYKVIRKRAEKLVNSVPRMYRQQSSDEYQILKISDLIKAYPDTTDKEILEALMDKAPTKQINYNVI